MTAARTSRSAPGSTTPTRVTHLAILDVLPTLDMWDVLHGVDAAVAFHLYLMAQPPGLPEQLIAGAPDAFFGYFLDAWGTDAASITRCPRRVPRGVPRRDPSIVADYRATATSTSTMTARTAPPGTRSRCRSPWSSRTGRGARLPRPPSGAPGRPTSPTRPSHCGHFMAEAAPELITDVLRTLRRK